MKKITIFTNHFLPGYRAGGPVTSIANLFKILDDKYDITIVTSNKDLGENNPYDIVEYDKKINYEGFNIVYLSKIDSSMVLKTIKENEPDLIYLNSFFSTFTQLVLLLSLRKQFVTPILLAPRGEMQENALAIKKVKKKVYLVFYKLLKLYNKVYFHATDTIEYNRIKKMFSVNHISTLPNVPKVGNNNALSKKKNELNLIFVSRIRDNKNLLLALQSLANTKATVTFDIYGPVEDEAYWKKCQSAMKTLPRNISTAYKGIVHPTEISNVMRKYHALLLPTKTENFGHVIVEAMQCGVIPIISNQTPWLDLPRQKAGWDLDLKDINSFTKVVYKLYEMNSQEYAQWSEGTIQFINDKLDMNELKEKYVEMFEKVMKLNE